MCHTAGIAFERRLLRPYLAGFLESVTSKPHGSFPHMGYWAKYDSPISSDANSSCGHTDRHPECQTYVLETRVIN